MSGRPREARSDARPVPSGSATSDHLTQLLFTGVERAPSGRHSPSGQWVIDAAGARNATLVAAGHEYMHQVLNEHTLFGQLLGALGMVGQLGDGRAVGLARKFMDQCETAHESYATFTSVVLSGVPPHRALADYPGYDVYYNSAACLSGALDPSTSLAGYHVVERALSECFSAPFPTGLFADGLDALKPREIPIDCRPDKRFRILRGLLPPLVPELLERVDHALLDTTGAADLGPSAGWGRRDLDAHLAVEETFADLLRDELRELLRDEGIPVLRSEEEELAALASLNAAIRRDHPEHAAILAITPEVIRGEWARIVESVTLGEQMVFRPSQKHVNVTSDVEAWVRFAQERQVESLVALVATPRRLRRQYDIEPCDWQSEGSEETVVWLLDPGPDQEPLSALWTLRYEDLDKTLRRLPELMIAVVIVASTLPGEEWWESWGERLQERGDVVLYGDTNVVDLVRRAQSENRHVTYSVFRISELEHLNCIVLDADLGGFPLLWLGSGIARALFVKFLRSEAASEPDDSLAQDEAVQIALRYIVNHECRTGLFQGASSSRTPSK